MLSEGAKAIWGAAPLNVPLPPMMGDLTYDTIDVFEEASHRLDPMDMDLVQDIE